MSARSEQQNPVFIFGSGRSGTTWLAAIFDSHPNTLYIHEPDEVIFDPSVPYIPTPDYARNPGPEVAKFGRRLVRTRALRAMQKRPFFRKSYRGLAGELARRTLIGGMALASKGLGHFLAIDRWPVPDFGGAEIAVPVVKSVSSPGRLPLFARAFPKARFIYILRHPCGVVASVKRGVALGKIGPAHLFDEHLALPLAKRHRLTPERRETMGEVERAAWVWTILNDFMMEACEGLENVRLLRYEDLCDDPISVARSLFEFAGLDWTPSTEAFLAGNLGAQGDASDYYGVVRNPRIAAERWRRHLDPADIETIERIAADSRPGRLFGLATKTAG